MKWGEFRRADLTTTSAGRRRRIILLLITVIVAAVALTTITIKFPGKRQLRGLLIDLELRGPEPGRYQELRDAVTRRLSDEPGPLQTVEIRLEYIHFTEAAGAGLDVSAADFLMLSPQGAPWHSYIGDAGDRLELVKRQIRQIALDGRIPILGICGGHQFLALAFGGTVDFIDPAFEGKRPETYPRQALAERGIVTLSTLCPDPIFAGVAEHPGTFLAAQSHYEEVKKIPSPFVNLARSALSEAQLIRIPNRMVYGMAFHPERGWAPQGVDGAPATAGRRLLGNFFSMVAQSR